MTPEAEENRSGISPSGQLDDQHGLVGRPNESAIQDRALEGRSGDLLDRGEFVESLVRALIVDQRDAEGRLIGRSATGYVVGLTGTWGLGKSSVLNMTAERLNEMDHVSAVVFNPWLFSGRDELLDGFFGTLRQALGKSLGEHAQDLRNQLDRYWGALQSVVRLGAIGLDTMGGGGVASAAATQLDGLRPGKAPELSALDERKALEEKLAEAKIAVVVLVDEVDRVEDDEIRAIAQFLKAIGDIKGISYLVAYEPSRVADALGRGDGPERIERGERYLEKIVQHPIPLRPLFAEDVDVLIGHALEKHSVQLPEPDSSQVKILTEVKKSIETPREIKRLIGSYAILARPLADEICPYDLLAYCWMISRSPTLQRQIASNIDRLVDDPSELEMAERFSLSRDNEKKVSPADVLGPSAEPYDRLLRLLFPHFGYARDVNEQQGMRISKRQNLIRLLYLGDPPRLVSRKEVAELWELSGKAALQERLRALKENDRLRPLLDRLDDTVEQLPQDGDAVFWPALSRIVTRDDSWIATINHDRAAAEDAASILLRVGVRSGGDSSRFLQAMTVLVEAGDLALVPYILRKHLFHYGMTKHSTRKRGDFFAMSESNTRELLERELPRYRAAVFDGTALQNLPNTEVIHIITNVEEWSDELRRSLTDQLDSREAIATLAALMLPAGYLAEKDYFDELFDASVVKKRLDSFDDISTWNVDPSVADSVERFSRILDGHDPMFVDDDL